MHHTWAKATLGAAAALVLAGAAQAGEPEYWSVVGVAPDDVLNIREHPSAEADILGTIPPNSRRLRGFGCVASPPEGRQWCRIKYGQTDGWVRQRYLRREAEG